MPFAIERCIGYVTDSAMKLIADAFNNRLKDDNLTRIQWIALYYIHREGPISQRKLSIMMKVQDSSAARLIDRLERDGLVKRDKLPTDRRVFVLSLTKEGQALFEKVLPIGVKYSKDLVNGISEEDLKTFEKVLKQLTVNVSAKDETIVEQ